MVKLPKRSKLNQLKSRWEDCNRCPLCEHRKSVVFIRGSIPCDVLFVGEAPGRSEDLLGKPFQGPAGKLLDRMVSRAEKQSIPVKTAFTNAVGCIPHKRSEEIKPPEEEHIDACSTKALSELQIADPQVVVLVGKAAEDWANIAIPDLCLDENKVFSMVHPGKILRLSKDKQPLLLQEVTDKLASIFNNLIPF